MSWPYPFTIGEVMRRGAEVARQHELREKQLRRDDDQRRRVCGYCGRKRPCPEHSDLP